MLKHLVIFFTTVLLLTTAACNKQQDTPSQPVLGNLSDLPKEHRTMLKKIFTKDLTEQLQQYAQNNPKPHVLWNGAFDFYDIFSSIDSEQMGRQASISYDVQNVWKLELLEKNINTYDKLFGLNTTQVQNLMTFLGATNAPFALQFIQYMETKNLIDQDSLIHFFAEPLAIDEQTFQNIKQILLYKRHFNLDKNDLVRTFANTNDSRFVVELLKISLKQGYLNTQDLISTTFNSEPASFSDMIYNRRWHSFPDGDAFENDVYGNFNFHIPTQLTLKHIFAAMPLVIQYLNSFSEDIFYDEYGNPYYFYAFLMSGDRYSQPKYEKEYKELGYHNHSDALIPFYKKQVLDWKYLNKEQENILLFSIRNGNIDKPSAQFLLDQDVPIEQTNQQGQNILQYCILYNGAQNEPDRVKEHFEWTLKFYQEHKEYFDAPPSIGVEAAPACRNIQVFNLFAKEDKDLLTSKDKQGKDLQSLVTPEFWQYIQQEF